MSLSPPPPPLRLTARPLVGVAVSLALGIVVGQEVGGVAWWTGVIVLSMIGVGLHAFATRRSLVTLHRMVLAGAVLLASLGLGGLRISAWTTPSPDSVALVAQNLDAMSVEAPVTTWARIADVPSHSDWSIRFSADVDSVRIGERVDAAMGRIQVSMARNGFDGALLYPALQLGDRIRLNGHLRTLPGKRNPADFDYGAFLAHRGIDATLHLRDGEAVRFLAPTRRLDHRMALAVQRRVRESVRRFVPNPESQAVLLALLLADRSGLEDATTDAFRTTGLMHLLAVSGLHVFLVGLTVYALLGPLLARAGLPLRRALWVRAAISLGLLALYVLVTGASVSVVRAFVMASVLVVGRALGRRVDTLNALGAAALVLLVIRPTALFEVGFQLSFAAVAALVTLTPPLTQAVSVRWRSGSVGRWVTSSSVASLAATLGTAPVLFVHFGRVPLAGLLLNLPAIPLTGLTLGSGIATAAAPAPILAETFGALASWSGALLVWISEVGAEGLGAVALNRFVSDGWMIGAFALLLLAGALWQRPLARRRIGLVALGCLVLSVGTSVWRGDAVPRLDVVFLDVGQGDATLIRTPNGRHLLIDAGVRSPYRDEGERTVVPHLERYGIRHLDALILTHADADHIGGAPSVLRSVSVGRLVHNGQAKDSEAWTDLMHVADSLHILQQTVTAGDSLAIDAGVRIRVLGPTREPTSTDDANEASIVLHIEHGRTRWLLMGDAETEGEANLVARYGDLLQADVVKVGHHGSQTSSAPALVAAASGRGDSLPIRLTTDASFGPGYAVVSVARHNRYGLPDAEPLLRWQAAGAKVLQTADEGAVWLRSDGEMVERMDWRR